MVEEVTTILERTKENQNSREAVDKKDSMVVNESYNFNASTIRSMAMLLLIILQILEIKLKRSLIMVKN